jgi:hypothetical protein
MEIIVGSDGYFTGSWRLRFYVPSSLLIAVETEKRKKKAISHPEHTYSLRTPGVGFDEGDVHHDVLLLISIDSILTISEMPMTTPLWVERGRTAISVSTAIDTTTTYLDGL